MRRRHLLLLFPFWFTASAQPLDLPQASPVDAVHVYIIPTDEVPEQAAGLIARGLSKATGLWIKSTMWAPAGNLEPFAGTNQYAAEDYLPMGAKAARVLREVSPRTYFIVLTNRDINSSSRNFRFQYSLHSPMANTSVLSLARLRHTAAGAPAQPELVADRVAKMLMRIVGEMRLGWKRSDEPSDLMYAPIMSTDDIDRMSLLHTVQSRQGGASKP